MPGVKVMFIVEYGGGLVWICAKGNAYILYTDNQTNDVINSPSAYKRKEVNASSTLIQQRQRALTTTTHSITFYLDSMSMFRVVIITSSGSVNCYECSKGVGVKLLQVYRQANATKSSSVLCISVSPDGMNVAVGYDSGGFAIFTVFGYLTIDTSTIDIVGDSTLCHLLNTNCSIEEQIDALFDDYLHGVKSIVCTRFNAKYRSGEATAMR